MQWLLDEFLGIWQAGVRERQGFQSSSEESDAAVEGNLRKPSDDRCTYIATRTYVHAVCYDNFSLIL